LSAMTFSALLTLARPDWNPQGALLLALGAVLFFLSDAILAWDRFLRPLRAPEVLMIPYLLGQVGIAVGAWLTFA
ncbi:lysoplasmalogenase family protein, partial [Anaerolinea sp.]